MGFKWHLLAGVSMGKTDTIGVVFSSSVASSVIDFD